MEKNPWLGWHKLKHSWNMIDVFSPEDLVQIRNVELEWGRRLPLSEAV